MAFRFKRKESIAAGFARIAAEQIGEAATALERSSGVHKARRCIKRLRALLRLFRRALPDGSFQREDEALRNVARSLAPLRDAQIRLAVFDSVTRHLKAPGVAIARCDIFAPPEAAATEHSPASRLRSAITGLHVIGARLPGLKPDSGWSVLERGLRATCRLARKAHAAAHAELSTPAIHAWRRRSKYFEYQLHLLRKMDPSRMKRCIRTAGRLTELLGDDHDLAVLDRNLVSASVPEELLEKLQTRIARRRKKLQRRAFAAGSELFFEKPSVSVHELGRLWKRWQRG